jgi:hypothetical protein
MRADLGLSLAMRGRFMMRIAHKTTERVHVRLEPQQRAALEAFAARHGATVTACVRATIDLLLAQEGLEDQA